MSFAAKLFSFEGRIGRGDWWTLGGLVMIAQVAISVLVFQAQGGFGPPVPLDALGKPAADPSAFRGAGPLGVLLAIMVAGLAGAWPNLALSVKRWHDRDKGAAWVLINFIPWVGPLWATVELGLLGGTPGGNRYGPEPGATRSIGEVFGDADEDAERAEAAIARWRSEAQPRSSAPTSGWMTPATAAPGAPSIGFGKRTNMPPEW